MLFLKQSTSVDVGIGPFLDETDGKTAETGLTITQPDIRLKKNGGAWAQKNAAQTLSHEESGWYEVTLDATDTNTLGHLLVAVHESGALPVWHEFLVVPAAVYDALVSGSGNGVRADVQALAAGSITATVIATDAIDADAIADNAINAAAIAADAITAAKIADGAIDAATFAAGAINAAAIAADAITAAKVAADVSAEIADAVWDEDATGHQTQGSFGQAIGDPGADTDTIFGLVNTNLNATVSSRASQASLDTVDDFLDTEIAAIKAKTDNLPTDPADASDIAGSFSTLASAIDTIDNFLDTEMAATLAAVLNLVAAGYTRTGTAQAGAATTITLDAGASATDDLYNNQIVVIASGTGAGQARFIIDYVGATKVATVATWATNPSSDSVFYLLPFGAIPGATAPTASEVADAVWDEALAGHTTAGSAGKALSDAGAAGDPWSTALPGAYGAGTAGKIIGDNLNATVGSRASQTSVDGLTASRILRTGTLQAGGAQAATLDAGASATNDFYNGVMLVVTGGTGAGQVRLVYDYNGATKVATTVPGWITEPDNTSTFALVTQAYISHVQGNVLGSVAQIAASGIDTSSFAPGAINAAAIAADAIGASELAADAIAEIVDAVWAEDINGSPASAHVEYLTATVTTIDTDTDVLAQLVAQHPYWAFAQPPSGITAAGSGASTIVLDASASTTNDVYNGSILVITAGTGKGQARLITDYVGGTVTATVSPAWQTTPVEGDSVWAIYPAALVSGLSTAAKAEVNAEADTAIADARLDELLAADSDIDGAAPPTVGSVFHELMSKTTGSFSFDQTTDSLEAVRDKFADIEADTQDLQARVPDALVSGRIKAVAQVVDDKTGYAIGAGGISASSFAAGAIDSAAIAADAIGAAEIADGAIDAAALAQDAAQEIADEILNRNLAGGGSGNTRNVRNALRALRNRVAEASGTVTVYQEDDSTAAWTAAVTRTSGADPITEVDPG